MYLGAGPSVHLQPILPFRNDAAASNKTIPDVDELSELAAESFILAFALSYLHIQYNRHPDHTHHGPATCGQQFNGSSLIFRFVFEISVFLVRRRKSSV
jgi:hypothetical protein